MTNLESKVAIVTGSSRGIGAATAERLAADGATVVVNYFRSASRAEDVVERVQRAGGKAIAIQADMGEWSQAQMLVEQTGKEFGRVDILVNNAVEPVGREPIEQISEEFMKRQFAVNIQGPIAAIQAAVPWFPEEGGRIINISSTIAVHPVAQSGVMVATKGGLEALTRALSVELGPRNITVNTVAPGLVETELIRTNTEEIDKVLIAMTPLGRIGKPADLADTVALLASSDARWLTGQLVHATGGQIPSGYLAVADLL